MKKHGEAVKARILDRGVALLGDGMHCVTARAIGRFLSMSHTAVLYHFGDAAGLQSAVAERAVEIGHREAVRHLIAIRHPAVSSMDEAAKLAILGA